VLSINFLSTTSLIHPVCTTHNTATQEPNYQVLGICQGQRHKRGYSTEGLNICILCAAVHEENEFLDLLFDGRRQEEAELGLRRGDERPVQADRSDPHLLPEEEWNAEAGKCLPFVSRTT
jgi:hypothetical protein